MSNPIKIALFAAALVAGPIAVSAPAKAAVAVTFDAGSVAFGYTDGYWDRDHHWHRWHNAHEREDWRAANADHYMAQRHTHDADKGWHDNDHWWEHH
jgi:hypothetical protein